MSEKVKPVPEGYHTITPLIIADGAAKLIGFIEKAFNGKQMFRHDLPDGKIMHAQVRIGDSTVMIADSMEQFPANKVIFYLYVEDVDGMYKQAVAAGGKSLREPTNEFYGDRTSGVQDEFGNQWWISTHIEDVSDEELKRRQEEMMKKQAAAAAN